MQFQPATARAGANIALVKYWGKRDAELNLPAAGSISLTLDGLSTTTTVTPDDGLEKDRLILGGQPADASRISPVLDLLRGILGGGPFCQVESRNNFPTGAGLASSASAFAALVVAADRAFGLELSAERLSELARRGSGSAARSIFGGFVEMDAGRLADGSDCIAHRLLDGQEWPLELVVAITDDASKDVSSTDGMNRTMQTSPYYSAWVDTVPADLETARRAIQARDFAALAAVAEHSALKMHASALAAQPGLLYWNAATLACVHAIRSLQASACDVFFTMDAGPQVKAVCPPDQAARVAEALAATPGVIRVLRTGLGEGAAVLT